MSFLSARLTLCSLMLVVLSACATSVHDPLAAALSANTARPELQRVLERADEHRLQIVVGTVETDARGNAYLRQHKYRVSNEYFYPASSIKLFAAVAAAETIERLREQSGTALTLDTALLIHPLFDDDVLESQDASNLDGGTITVRHAIRKIFLVSDNEAYNTLYEMAGQHGIRRSMQSAGLNDARIVQRLSEARTPAENRRYPRIDFIGPELLYTLPARTSVALPPLAAISRLKVGERFYAGGELVDEAMDFSEKNYIPITELQRGLCKLVRPDIDCSGGPGFKLSDDARETMLDSMSQYPRESRNPVYDAADFPDDYVKPLLPGVARVIPREHLRIYNKTGQAYGFSIENAWVEDIRTGRGFFLTATLYTNADGTLNDDQYEADSVAMPFFEALGEVLARELWAREH